jgi:flavin reductase (DIM6/NTAB) family NADH-FMN oxidoreductase RutF
VCRAHRANALRHPPHGHNPQIPRLDIDPTAHGPGQFYSFLTSVIVPRPIAWVSTRSPEGVDNLAPHSFFTVASVDPPIVQFTSVGRKDSLRNVERTREFVVCLTPEPLFEEVNATATDFPAEVSEFDAVGVEREASLRVAPPRVARSPVVLECTLHTTLTFGTGTVVLGRVVNAAIDEDALVGGRPAIERLRPLARLGANEWATIGEIREISRIGYREWPGHYKTPGIRRG